MSNEEHNQQRKPKKMRLCHDANMMSNITPPTRIIDCTAIDIVIRDNDDVLGTILSFLDAIELSQKKPVCKQWKNLCKIVIDRKLIFPKKPFASNEELRNVVSDYTSWQRNPDKAENIATVYGWPIDEWDVSQIQDFSYVFHEKRNFNEYIGSWNVSRANNMEGMFGYAEKFNQDISSWNVTNVVNMYGMFSGATTIDQDISSWNVANVTSMSCMFHKATKFNQDVSSWNVANVTDMSYMFNGATIFNQNRSIIVYYNS